MKIYPGRIVLALIAALAPGLPAIADDQNLTGLPLYPNNTGGMMMGGKNPNGCMVYNSGSRDGVKAVAAWYVAHGAGRPALSDNSYGGTQADFGVHNKAQIVIFDTRVAKMGTTITLSKNCGHSSS